MSPDPDHEPPGVWASWRFNPAPLRAARLAALYWDFITVVWLLMYLAIFWL